MISERLSIVLLCKDMQWGYDVYMRQPEWFIEILRIVRGCDAEYSNRMAKIANRRSRSRN